MQKLSISVSRKFEIVISCILHVIRILFWDNELQNSATSCNNCYSKNGMLTITGIKYKNHKMFLILHHIHNVAQKIACR